MLKFSPSELQFQSLEEAEITSRLRFQNVSTEFLKIKLLPDHSKDVRATFARGDPLFKKVAPGVFSDILVSTTVTEHLDDAVVLLLNESVEVRVPVKYVAPSASIDVSNDVDFGDLMKDEEVHVLWTHLINSGTAQADFTIVASDVHDARVKVFPDSGTIAPAGSELCEFPIRVEFVGSKLGVCHETVRVVVGDELHTEFEIKANVTPQRLLVIDPVTQAPTTSIDMGCVYYGTEREFQQTIFNDRLDPTMFVITPLSHSVWRYTANGRDPCYMYTDASDIVLANPWDGTLTAQEKRLCTFTFQPFLPGVGVDDSLSNLPYNGRRDFVCTFRVECLSQPGINHTITFSGSAIVPSYRISKKRLRFQDCIVGDTEVVFFQIQNLSKQLPLTYAVQSIAHFNFTPSEGIILADASETVRAAFIPKQPGLLKRSIEIRLGHGTITVNLPVSGTGVAERRDEMTLRATSRAKSGRAIPFKVSDKHVPKSAPLDCGVPKRSVFSQTNMRKATARLCPLTSARVEQAAHGSHSAHPTPSSSTRSSLSARGASSAKGGRSYQQGAPQRKLLSPSSTMGRNKRVDMKQSKALSPPSSETGSVAGSSTFRGRGTRGKAYSSNSKHSKEQAVEPLRPLEIQKLVFSPSGSIDFGKMCVESTAHRIITITNPLPKSVILKCDCPRDEFSVSLSKKSLRTGGSVELSIVLGNITSETPAKLKSHIEVSINKVHTLKIPVQAQIVPFNVSLSTSSISLSCGYCVKIARPCSYVTVSNQFGRESYFYWELYETYKGKQKVVKDGGAFTVEPDEGRLGAFMDMQVQVVLHPELYNPKCQYRLGLVLDKAEDVRSIDCRAVFENSKCRFMESRTVFGTISQSSKNTQTAVLTNEGKVDAYFTIQSVSSQFELADIHITPSSGRVPAHSTQDLTISCSASRLGKLDAAIVVDVKDQKPLKHIISGQVVPIKLHVDRDSFDFGQMLLGQTRSLPVSITNNSGCDVEVAFDYGFLSGFSTHLDIFDGVDSEIDTVTLPTNVTKTLYIQLSAQEVCAFGDKVGVTANGHHVSSFSVKGTVLAASVSVLPRLIDFGPLRLGAEATAKLTLKQTGSANTELLFDCARLAAAGIKLKHPDLKPFGDAALLPKSSPLAKNRLRKKPTEAGSLTGKQPSPSSSVQIAGSEEPFSPTSTTGRGRARSPRERRASLHLYSIRLGNKAPVEVDVVLDTSRSFGAISAALPVYLSVDDMEPFLSIAIKASEVKQELRLSTKELVLGCLPVGETKKVSFNVECVGYADPIELDATFEGKEGIGSGGINAQALTVVFPQGKVAQPGVPLPVEIHISSTTSTDFDQHVVVYDVAENTSSLRIRGMIDSTVFSKIVDMKHDSPEFAVVEDGLCRYFQIYGLSHAMHLTIPKSFTQKCGWLLADIISHLSAVKIPKLPLTRPETLSLEQQMGLVDNILEFLISRGALLQEVSSRDLLVPSANQERAWVLVLAQVARVLVLGQLPPRIGLSPRRSSIGNGLVTHPHEKLRHVIAWVNDSISRRGEASLARRVITNFDQDFKDGLVLADLILAHVPELEEFLPSAMFLECTTQTMYYHNAISVVRALKLLKIYLNVDARDIVFPNESFITLLVVQLAYTLPKFLCSPESLHQDGFLGTSGSMPFTLTNSHTKKSINYHILQFGSSHFKIQDRVKVGPKESVAVPCKVTSVVSGTHECEVICIGYCVNSTTPNVERFSLTMNVRQKPSSNVLEMETKCYDQHTRLLALNKPFRSCKRCRVSTFETTADGQVLYPQYPSFWVDDEELDFTNTQTREVPVNFLPTRLGEHHLSILLRDEQSGFERCYGVVGVALTPDPLQTMSWTSQLQKISDFKIKVPYTNDARRAALSRISLTTEGLNNLCTRASEPEKGTSGVKEQPTTDIFSAKDVQLDVKIVGCPYATGPQRILLRPPPSMLPKKTRASTLSMIDELDMATELTLAFQPVASGSYTFDVHLIGPEDVRVYRIFADVSESLEVDCGTEAEVGSSSSVALTITNPCSSDHKVELCMEGDVMQFSCEDTIMVGAQASATLLVLFAPTEAGQHNCTVVARDLHTKVSSFYHIRAKALPPIDTSKQVLTRTRSAMSATPNKSLIVPCTVWETKVFRIRLKNDLREEVTYSVRFESTEVLDEELVFDEEIVIAPLSVELLTCEYSPLREGDTAGVLIVDDGGENITPFQIEFQASARAPIVLPAVSITQGEQRVVSIPVTNPLDVPMSVYVDVDDTALGLLDFMPGEMSLEGCGTGEFECLLHPQKELSSNVSDPNEALSITKTINVRGEFGIKWVYVLPVTVNPEGFAGSDATGTQQFVVSGKCGHEELFELEVNNNSDTGRTYTFSLVEDDTDHDDIVGSASAKFILLKKKLKVPAMSKRALPVCFVPQYVCKHTATVTATSDDESVPDKQWVIAGIGQPSKSGKMCVLKCLTDTPTQQTFSIKLHDVSPFCDVFRIHAHMEGFDAFKTADCVVSDIEDGVLKVTCDVEAELAGKTFGSIEVYHEDGFYWERPLTVDVHAPIIGTIDIQATSFRNLVTQEIVIPKKYVEEDGAYNAWFTNRPKCFSIESDSGTCSGGADLRLLVTFDPTLSKGNTATELTVQFDSGKEVAFEIHGVQPGM